MTHPIYIYIYHSYHLIVRICVIWAFQPYDQDGTSTKCEAEEGHLLGHAFFPWVFVPYISNNLANEFSSQAFPQCMLSHLNVNVGFAWHLKQTLCTLWACRVRGGKALGQTACWTWYSPTPRPTWGDTSEGLGEIWVVRNAMQWTVSVKYRSFILLICQEVTFSVYCEAKQMQAQARMSSKM